MKYIEFNKTLCNVTFLMNVIDLQSKCAIEMTSETQSAGFFQIYFIEQAEGYLKLNESKIDLKPCTLIFISQDQKYSWHLSSDQFEGKLMVFQEDFLNDFFSDQYFIYRLLFFYQTTYPLSMPISKPLFEDTMGKLSDIRQEILHVQSDSAHMIRSILYNILITINRAYAEHNHIDHAIALDNTAYQFRKLVEKHIYTDHKVEDYSSMMNLSRVAINKAVKSQFNITATDFIKSRLLFEIKMKLIHTAKTVSEIAHEFNFSEIQHIHRFFKQKTGISPMEYRLNYQNEGT
ncbi:helix-turn-helix domain-containing protein [Aureibacter tunicatorum]|uniref:AraC family transcriptional activator of pobA n=1 Tax=Aureibacter tunicatorum TaxID=866807 RepID=A0AAE3XR74_9BACT|nr:AraC family transcriptional regulator [Aureibacter tunicatorum]MDR6240435.1 AraC family transcriptional activator of pobA [Aureibacter tunicatorum]BDD05686.1 AraC family transcriptional regulator [Aureibacter tunicatorum]